MQYSCCYWYVHDISAACSGDSLLSRTDGQSMWASAQKDAVPREPDYSSIEQLFCLPVAEPKDKGAAAPVKKEPKEVCLANTQTDRGPDAGQTRPISTAE